jgi:hypothetical protein
MVKMCENCIYVINSNLKVFKKCKMTGKNMMFNDVCDKHKFEEPIPDFIQDLFGSFKRK